MSGAAHLPGDQQTASAAPCDAVPEIECRVLQYFRQHSGAMDSPEGIARFWVHADREVVQRCLDDLHARGILHRRVIAGTGFYSLRQESAQRAARHISPVTPSVSMSDVHGRVLVVDDDPSVRKFMVEALSEAGHSVAAAEDGARAVEMIEADPFDLVVTDLVMPRMSGMELLEAVKQRKQSTDVIIVTAHASLETAVEALRLGAYDLITKPLDDIELLHRSVARALEKRRLTADNRLLVDKLQSRNLELKETVARMAAINEIGRATTGLLDADEFYGTLVRLVAQHLGARRVSVLMSDPATRSMSLVASIGITDQQAFKRCVRIGEGIAGHVAASQAPLLIQDIERSEFKALGAKSRYATPSFMSSPLVASCPIRYRSTRVGVINVADKISGDPFSETDLEFLSTLASQVAVAVENARLVREMEDGYLGALVALIQAVEDSDSRTRGHSLRVTELSGAVAREMGLSRSRVDCLLHAAALHELGRCSERVATSGNRERRPGPGDGWSAIDALATERILAPIASLKAAREIILRSAEPFQTPPRGLGAEGSGPPMESRILAACDHFMRATSSCGTDPEDTHKALLAVDEQAGRGLDPDVVAALRHVVESGMEGRVIERDTADRGGPE